MSDDERAFRKIVGDDPGPRAVPFVTDPSDPAFTDSFRESVERFVWANNDESPAQPTKG